LKKYCIVDLLQFFKKSLLKCAILVHATILDYLKKSSSMICLYLKVEQNVEEFFEKSQFLKIWDQKPVFAAYSNISAILDFLPKISTDSSSEHENLYESPSRCCENIIAHETLISYISSPTMSKPQPKRTG
jgi:hypothetical protein